MPHGERVKVFLALMEHRVGAESHLIRPGKPIIPLQPFGWLRRMEITEIVDALALQVLMLAICLFLNMTLLHFDIYLGTIIDPTVYIQALSFLLAILWRDLAVADLYIKHRTLDDRR